MVTIVDFQTRKTSEGKEFGVLILQGGIETVKSQKTGKSFMTARKVSIPCTFDEQSARTMIGTKLPGQIEKVECEPYDYKLPDSGEVVKLTYKYEYNESPSNIEENVFEVVH